VLAALIVLPLWKGAHHVRHLSIDFRGAERDLWVAPILYGVATVASLAGILAVVRL
jgi:fumarate reductase subunit D